MTTMCPINGDPSEMPLDLAAVLADEELLNKLGDPVALAEIAPGLETEVVRTLVAWRDGIRVGHGHDALDLLPLEDALTALVAARYRRNRQVAARLRRWVITALVIATVLLAIIVLAGCGGASVAQRTRQTTESLAAAPPVSVKADGVPAYNPNYFGGGRWASAQDGPAGPDCTTRGLVLYGETLTSGGQPFDGADRDKCLEDGKFRDVYTGLAVDPEVADEEIDHVLAQCDAWRLGGHRWNRDQLWAFRNDQGNLRATTGEVNGRKSCLGPDEWRPPAQSGWCAYAQTYEGTATRWQLPISTPRRAALDEMLATCR